MKPLEAYLVGICNDDGFWFEVALVFSASAEQAAWLVYPERDGEKIASIVAGNEEESVKRWPEVDELATAEPSVNHSPDALLRPYGWHFEDEDQCEGCETWSDDVCGDCYLCPTCRATAKDDDPCENCQEGVAVAQSSAEVPTL